jgi:flagellar capping protein FliD
MTRIQSSTGLITGIPIEETVNKLMEVAARPRTVLEDRTKLLQTEQAAVAQLSSLVLAFQFEANRFGSESVFQSKAVNSSDTDVLTAAILGGTPGILHGSRSLMLQDVDGQVTEAHSASAGLDYPGIGPQLAALAEAGRIEVAAATDREAVAAMKATTRTEGILPALETAHAVAALPKLLAGLGGVGGGWPDEIANSVETIDFYENGGVKRVRLASKATARRTILEVSGKLKSQPGDSMDALAEAIRADLSRGAPG